MSRRQDAELDALYAELPAIDCQGFCYDSCGPIDMSDAERERIRREGGVLIERGSWFDHTGPITCPALTWDRKCSVYRIRPLICRIWGLTKRMICTYGCRPERWITEAEAYEWMARAFEISGDARMARVSRLAAQPEHAQAVSDIRDWLNLHPEG